MNSQTPMSFINLRNVKKNFGATTVVHDFSLAIEKGEFVSFLGPSGCGKTTILRMVAGFESVSGGAISIAGRDVTGLPPAQRDVGMVFQAYALFPNMTVADNIAFGLRVKNAPQAEIKSRVEEMLALIKLPQLAQRYPYQLSGGQQQRVALARALAVSPKVLLLDEPLSALDAKIRISLREEIRGLQRKLGITTIFVTHDQEEALSMSDRIVVMHEGRAEQVGTPPEIYNRPTTRFVAAFVGTLNILETTVIDSASGGLTLDGQPVSAGRRLDAAPGHIISIALRPEALTLAPQPQGQKLSGVVEDVAFLGAIVRVKLRLDRQILSLDAFNQSGLTPPRIGERIDIFLRGDDVLLLGNG